MLIKLANTLAALRSQADAVLPQIPEDGTRSGPLDAARRAGRLPRSDPPLPRGVMLGCAIRSMPTLRDMPALA